MAKKSKIAKARKQREVIEKYAAVRKELKEAGDYLALAKFRKIRIRTGIKIAI